MKVPSWKTITPAAAASLALAIARAGGDSLPSAKVSAALIATTRAAPGSCHRRRAVAGCDSRPEHEGQRGLERKRAVQAAAHQPPPDRA